jgi:hypothetical protein
MLRELKRQFFRQNLPCSLFFRFFFSGFQGFSLAGSEGPASASVRLFVASASDGFVSICVSDALAVFLGVVLEDFIVSSTSSTLTILFLLGVAVRSFCAFGTVTSAEGLITSNIFVFSTSASSILMAFGSPDLAGDAFGIVASSSFLY